MDFLIGLIGCVIVAAAVDVHRPNDKIKVFSKYWFLEILLLTIGMNLFAYSLTI